MSEKKQFFISYNKADLKWAQWIAFELEKKGYSVLFQDRDATSGRDFLEWMQNAIESTDYTIGVLTPAYLTGEFSRLEWNAAFKAKKLLPFRVEEVELEGWYDAVGYINLVGLPETHALAEIEKALANSANYFKDAPEFPGPQGVAEGESPEQSVIKPERFPGSVPAAWKVPFNRNPNFTGRQALLDQLHGNLAGGTTTALTQAISGLGGVGKTQLALEYSYRFRSEYDAILWVAAENPTSLQADYASLAHELGLPQADAQEIDTIIKAVRAHLGRTKDWLLVFDNATDAASIAGFLPQASSGHVIITSRNPNWSGVAQPLQVRTWPRDEAITFLEARTGFDDPTGADALAALLGDLPLALAQAGAYIAASPLISSYSAYIDLFEKERDALWQDEASPIGYDKTIGTTWKVALDAAQAASSGGGLLLNLCAFMAPEGIPVSLLSEAEGHLPESSTLGSALELNRAINALSQYSLVTVEEDWLSVHRLVQLITRERMEEGEVYIEALLEASNARWPNERYTAWDELSILYPHVNVLIEHAEERAIASETLGSICDSVGTYLEDHGQYKEAGPLFQKAVQIYESMLGEQHPATAISYDNLAGLYVNQGRYEEAEPLYLKSISIKESVLGEQHPDTATSYNNLAVLYESQGRYEEAEPLYLKALKIHEAVLGEQHPNTAGSYNNLAALYDSQGRYEEAEPLYLKSISIKESVLGEQHPDTAISYNNLAELYRNQGRYEEAEPLFLKALEVTESMLGEQHPNTATSYNNLAELYRNQGRYEEAEPLYLKDLSINEAVLGEQHPNTAATYNNLALLYENQGRYEEALIFIKKALEIVERTLGASHHYSQSARESLERIKKACG